MDEKARQLLDQIADHPPRSVLQPHLQLIRQLRRKRFTYRGIARFLQTELGLSVHWTTIHSFLEVRTRRRCDEVLSQDQLPDPRPTPAAVSAPQTTPTDIEALKRDYAV